MSAAAVDKTPSSRVPTSQNVPVSFRGALAPVVHERLVKALGGKRAAEVMIDALARLDDRAIETPQDMLDMADALIKSGGLVQAVGRSLKVMALLRGAVER